MGAHKTLFWPKPVLSQSSLKVYNSSSDSYAERDGDSNGTKISSNVATCWVRTKQFFGAHYRVKFTKIVKTEVFRISIETQRRLHLYGSFWYHSKARHLLCRMMCNMPYSIIMKHWEKRLKLLTTRICIYARMSYMSLIRASPSHQNLSLFSWVHSDIMQFPMSYKTA